MAAEEWWSFSNPVPIRDGILYGEGVMLATGGGVRYRTIEADEVYHSEDGLEASNIYAIVSTSVGVIAISEFGRVAFFDEVKKNWRVLNRSYEKNQSRVVPGASVAAGAIITISFEDRLSFFDINKAASVITLNRISSKNLSVDKISRIAIHGDSLYVRLGNSAYARVMKWNDMNADTRLTDPESWTKVDDWESMDDLKLRESMWTISSKKGTYELTSYSVNYVEDGKKHYLSIRDDFQIEKLYEIQNMPKGGFIGASPDGKLAVSDASSWWNSEFSIGVGSAEATSDQRIKVISALPDGTVLFHIWGMGFFIFSKNGNQLEYSLKPSSGHCFDDFVKNWTIATSSTVAPDGSGFLTATARDDGYSLVYITKHGEAHCAKVGDGFTVGGPMYATVNENGSWVVYMGAKESLNSDNGRFDIITFPPPRSNGNEIVNWKIRSIGGISPPLLDLAYDSVSNRIWTVSSSTIAYYDDDQDTVYAPTSIDGLRGAEFTSIEADPHGNLWAGTANQGVYKLSLKGRSPDTLRSARFTTASGLFNNNVKDVAIDPVLGIACFAHDNGASCYRRNDFKSAKKNMTDSASFDVAVYPVPYRPKIHKALVIENIAEDATVSIYNRGGALMRSFHGDEILGGRLEWDGKGKDQRLVAPGVYYYVINAASKTKKGKIIIIH